MKNKKIRSFLLGALSMLIICISIIPAHGEGIMKNIDAIVGGTKIYIDGQEKIFTNVKGEIVFPVIIEGTTYIPVRGIGEIFGEKVDWDGSTYTVYIGDSNYRKPAANLFDINIFLSSQEIREIVKDNTSKAYREGKMFNEKSSSITYDLDKKYSKLRGTIALQDKSRNHSTDCIVKIYIDEKLLSTYNMIAGTYPQDINIDVKTVSKLKIVIDNVDNANLIFSGFELFN